MLIHFFILITIVNLSYSSFISNEELLIPFTLIKSSRNNQHYFSVEIKLGSNSQAFNVELDTTSGNSWVPSAKCGNCEGVLYDPILSSSSQQLDMEVVLYDEDCVVTGYKVFDQLQINNLSVNKYGFVHVTQYGINFNDNFQGKLGLGYRSVLGAGYNLLNSLKKNNQISQSMFSIYHINEKNGILALGGLIDKDNINTIGNPIGKNTPLCNVTLLHYESVDYIYREGWICFLTHFIISEKYPDFYENKIALDPVVFDSAYDYISIPLKYYYVIKERLFDSFLPESCTESIIEDIYLTEKYFICSNKTMDIKKLNVSFIIQGYAYSIKSNDLFKPINESHYESLLRFNMNNEIKFWMLGYPFMKNFIIAYDFELSQVSFQEGNGTIVNLTNDWKLWTERTKDFEYSESQEETKQYFTMAITISIILVVLLIFVISCIVIRAARKKRIDDTRPFMYPSN